MHAWTSPASLFSQGGKNKGNLIGIAGILGMTEKQQSYARSLKKSGGMSKTPFSEAEIWLMAFLSIRMLVSVGDVPPLIFWLRNNTSKPQTSHRGLHRFCKQGRWVPAFCAFPGVKVTGTR